MKKLEKLDVLMIIFAVVVCLFALVVMHGWPEGDWRLGWGFAAAIATFLASLTALYLAKMEERRQEKAIIIKARVDRPKAVSLTVRHKNQVLAILSRYENSQIGGKIIGLSRDRHKELSGYLKSIISSVEEVDISSFYTLEPRACEYYSSFIVYLMMAKDACDEAYFLRPDENKEEQLFSFLKESLQKSADSANAFLCEMGYKTRG